MDRRQLLMALDKAIDSAALDTALAATANAIRSKGGTAAQIAFDLNSRLGFKSAIDTLPTGGGGAGGDYNVSCVDNGDGTQNIQITDATGAVTVVPLSVTSNDTYTAPSGQAYSPVTVNVPAPTPEPPVLETVNITPGETAQTKTPSAGYDGIGEVHVGAVPSGYVGSGVARKSSADLTVSGATVNVPAGYYASAASRSVPVYDGSVS